MPDRRPSRRTLLGALAVGPATSISIPLVHTPSSEWHAAVKAWQDAETRIAPAHARFDAAERLWFVVEEETPDGPVSAAWMAMERARRDHDHQLDLHEDAFEALLNTRAPGLSAILWKLDLIRTMLGPDWPDLLNFLPDDLRAFEGGRYGL